MKPIVCTPQSARLAELTSSNNSYGVGNGERILDLQGPRYIWVVPPRRKAKDFRKTSGIQVEEGKLEYPSF